MTYISRCEHGTPMALCRKCFPDVSEHNDWSNYQYTHPVKELTDEEAIQLWDSIDIVPNEGMTGRLKVFAKAILKKAQEK